MFAQNWTSLIKNHYASLIISMQITAMINAEDVIS